MGLLFGDSESTCTAQCPDVKCPTLDIPPFACPNISCPVMEIPSMKFCNDVINGERSCAEIKFPDFKCEQVKCPDIPLPTFQCPSTKCSEIPQNCGQCFDSSIGLVVMVTVLVSLIILAVLIFKLIKNRRQNVGSEQMPQQTIMMPFSNQYKQGSLNNTR